MSQEVNPLRLVAETQFGVEGGSDNLVANGIYSVDDIVRPILTQGDVTGDPRMYYSYGQRRTRLKWRRVNRQGWISPKQQARGDKDTVIQIKFARPRRFNRIGFELLRVPQEWEVKYYDATRKRMVTLSDRRGSKVDGSLSGFKNNVESPQQAKNNAHKWRNYVYELPIIKTNLIEIHLNREIKNPPIDNLNQFYGLPRDTPYSLGLRNLKVKLRIRNEDDNDDDDDGTPTPIGTTERPVIVRYTSINAHDGDPNTYWESAPQGAANSVVPFYIDMRANDGSATVFDRIKLTPLWTGPDMSVYFSSDETTTPWSVSPNRGNLDVVGDASFEIDEGITVAGADEGFTISNDHVKLDLTQGFTVGTLFTPTDTNSGGTGAGGNRYLWTFERPDLALSFRFNPSSVGGSSMSGDFEIVKTVAGVDTTLFETTNGYSLDKDSQYGIVVGYTQNSQDPSSAMGWHFALSAEPATSTTVVVEDDENDPLTGFYPTDLTFGNNALDTLTRPAYGTFTNVWVRMDPWSEVAARAFLVSPTTFIKGEGDQSQRVNGFYGGVLVARLTKNREARVGPGSGYYTNKEWTPVLIDYSLQASQYLLPVLTAKYLKLEFTKLIARTYLTEEQQLVVRSFPRHVRDYYRSTTRVGQKGPYTLQFGRNYFEAVAPVPAPGDPRKLYDLRTVLDGGSPLGVPPTIFHGDQSSTEYSIHPDAFDGSNKYRELEFATIPMRFFRQGRHEYDVTYVNVEHRAFFVGIKDLRVFRADNTLQFDTREYQETYDDDVQIESRTGWRSVGQGVYASQTSGAEIVSRTFESFSKFETIQMAVLDSGWESGFTDSQIDLGGLSHLVDPQDGAFSAATDGGADSANSSHYNVVTGQYQGARGGGVIQVRRISGASDEYGVKTDTGIYQDTLTEDGARTSAVVRLQLPSTNLGRYELRLYANGVVVHSKPINIPVRRWMEVELGYIANTGDTDWQVAVVQTDARINEPMVIDMLGVWQNPIRWEVTNDAAVGIETLGDPDISDLGQPFLGSQEMPKTPRATSAGDYRDNPPQAFPLDEPFSVGDAPGYGYNWYPLLWPLNDPKAYFRFPSAGHLLRVRATALRTGAVVSGWTIVPWYIESSMVMRAPIDYNPPWGVSDQEDLLDTSRKPIFQTWNRFFPQRFSVNLYGYF